MKKSTISFEAVIVAFVMLTMLILVFLGVISRYVLHFSFSFTEELVCAMFVLLSTGRRAGQQGERPLYAGFDNRDDEAENEESIFNN